MDNNSYTAVLIDISSIQQYIYSSNKLKLNIGASYIIEHEVYGFLLNNSIKKVIGNEIDLNSWMSAPYQGLTNSVEIGYIGGGNALILIQSEEKAKEFVQTYSKLLLLYYPGIKPSFAILPGISLNESTFQNEMNALHRELRRNKQTNFRQTLIFKPGITNDCRLTGELEEFKDQHENYFISSVAKAKYEAFERAKDYYKAKFKSQLRGKFQFPLDFGDLGVADEKGYIAIVHVDGNSMGKKFMGCSSLCKFRELSAEVKRIGNEILDEVVKHIVDIFSDEKNELNSLIKLKKEDELNYLPFRPIISGGDDFTFACEGRLGIYLAEFLMRQFAKKQFDGEQLSSCGGISIVKTKYPFFRAYNLCEQLASEAKKMVKANKYGQDRNALHFMVAGNGFILEEYDKIVEYQFSVPPKNRLLNGPYYLTSPTNNLDNLKSKMYRIRYSDQKWPMSKLKELRNILKEGTAEQQYFVQTLKARGLNINDITGFNHEGLWENDCTPLYDIIELLDFYPKPLLKIK